MVQVVKHDLEFILKQIKIAEAHAAGGDLATLVAEAGGIDPNATGTPTQPHLLPYGLRTVDGTYNNLIDGREQWGAADNPFVPLTPPTYVSEGDDAFPYVPGNNNNYGAPGSVVDADPRIISNLIADQTSRNPAAKALYEQMLAEGKDVSRAELKDAAGNVVYQTPAVLDEAGNVVTPGEPVWVYTLVNVSPDIGDSAPYNSVFTLFGQFFDHGLDLIAKGGNGTVYIPLSPDDPLYNPASPQTNFMVMTRLTPGAVNTTTPWVDQNQTYTSHPSHQVFLREYAFDAAGKPTSTGSLLEGTRGLATWKDVKDQAREMLGIELTDADVGNIPLLRTDPYGNFIPDLVTGFAQVILGLGADGIPNTADDIVASGTPANPINPSTVTAIDPATGATLTGAVRIGHAFLDDIAHAAVPVSAGGILQQDSDSAAGYQNEDGTAGPVNTRGAQLAYDNELLDSHYITGDGRGNENIGLTAIHEVFHSEHNRQVEQVKEVALAASDLALLNEWLSVDVSALPTTAEEISALKWDGERLFQAARFTTEMQYQHLVFEEFGRKMQPDIDAFVFEPSADINPVIFTEFAQAVYRFGHSMLNENIDRIVENTDADGPGYIFDNISLFEGFLNPLAFGAVDEGGNVVVTHDQAAGAIIRGMSRQGGNEIDEFVTHVLRNQLVGIPLDLAAINIARGRDAGLPSLNQARTQFYQMAGQDSQLKPYTSWADFALNLQNPASIVNFIAAYGQHEELLKADVNTIDEKRAVASVLVMGGTVTLNAGTAQERVFTAGSDRFDFLNSTGAWTGRETGLNMIDLWIGGLAEKKMDFGGMLGSTFSFVFELQMENLQDADRFYYLSRVQGLNLLNELENNSFAEIIMRNTDLGGDGRTALPGDIFATPDHTLEMDAGKQIGADPTWSNPLMQAISPMVVRKDLDSDGDLDVLIYNGTDHVVMGGTAEGDLIVAGEGDDTVWGYEGNDTIEAGYGVDIIHGGDGDDIITNSGTDVGMTDKLHGEGGNDVIHGGSGLALVFGNEGQDFLVAGPDGKQVFGGTGNDYILGGDGGDFLMGNEGDDWIEGGARFDTLAGENSELMFNSTIIGHDVLNGGSSDTDYDAESGDDIMFQGEGIQRSNGMAGFDWAIHKGDTVAANSDLGIPIFDNQEAFILRDRFDLVEGLSGWKFNDVLTGRVAAVNTRAEITGTAAIPAPNSPLESYSNALLEKNVSLINGLDQLVAHLTRTTVTGADGKTEVVVMDTADASDIILGGGGSDTIQGKAGNDIVDGDKWLNVRIAVHANKNGAGAVVGSADGMTTKVYDASGNVLYGGKTLDALMFDGTLNPGQLKIVREILNGNAAGDVDTAVYGDRVENYAFTRNDDGSITVQHVTVTNEIDPTTGNNRLSDGVDRLFNIERLRFANGEFNVTDLLNVPATGVPTISDATPTEGFALTADTSGILDQNGIGAFSYQWQSSADGTTWANINGATGVNFTPEDLAGTAPGAHAGLQLRVVVSFTDGRGNPETVISAATGPVGLNWDGNPYVTNGFNGNNVFNGSAGDDLAEGVNQGIRSFLGIPIPVPGTGNDTLNGFGGNDTLSGFGGDDVLVGGTGDDVLIGGSGTDTAVFSGPLNNYSFGLNGANLVVTDNIGTDGTDTLSGIEDLRFGGQTLSLIQGSNTTNPLSGTSGADLVLGFDGNDNIDAGTGNDVILAGNGNDTINWDANLIGNTDGRDLVDGGAGEDTFDVDGRDFSSETYRVYTRDAAVAAGMTGLAATTEIVITRNGTNNAAIIAELDNIEEITIGTRNVAVPGGPSGGGAGGGFFGDNVVIIGNFNGTSLNFNTITIDGEAGDDTIDISALQSAHRIVFRSNGGNDTIVGTLRQQDVIELPPGMKLTDFTRTDNGDGTTSLVSTNHKITFVGSGKPIIRECTAGNPDQPDQLVAKDDSFTVKKGDVLTLTAAALLANDEAAEGAQLVLRSVDEDEHGEVVINQDGTITFTPKPGFSGEASFTYLVSDGRGNYDQGKVSITVSDETSNPAQPPAEQPPVNQPPAEQPPAVIPPVVEQPGPAVPAVPEDLVCQGGRGHDRLWGGDGHDRLFGEKGNDRLYGGDGADRLWGHDGHDRLDGGAGADRMWGGRGNDTYIVDDRADRVHESRGQGVDTVRASVSYSLAGTQVEKLVLTGAADLAATGNGLDNTLTGNRGHNSLRGGAGDDLLKGGAGADKLHGGSGADKLLGGAGDDLLKGGSGNDRLTGNAGEDVFVFERGGGHDTVTDFRHGQDKIDVSGLAGVEQKSDLQLWQMGSDTMIWNGTDIVVLKGVTASDLDNGDFIF